MDSKHLTLEQMAKRLNISTKTFRDTIRDQGIPFLRVGKRKKFDPAAVIAYLRTTEKPIESNVKAFPVAKRRRTRITSKRFAEAR